MPERSVSDPEEKDLATGSAGGIGSPGEDGATSMGASVGDIHAGIGETGFSLPLCGTVFGGQQTRTADELQHLRGACP